MVSSAMWSPPDQCVHQTLGSDDPGLSALATAIAEGNERALARGITVVENDPVQARKLLRALYGRANGAHVCGVTGPPGAGKSTLVQRIAMQLRKSDAKVAIVAIDPSSPFTGGALLGDRVRMEDGLQDAGIFMRSLASRGQLGGLSAATANTVALIDAAGFDVILIETVGAGQSEVDVMRLAQTTMVLSVPGLGDDLQAEKSGILEIADILVVNKADLPGAARVATDIAKMLTMIHVGQPGENRSCSDHGKSVTPEPESISTVEISWFPPVAETVGSSGEGIETLCDWIRRHRLYLEASGLWHRQSALRVQQQIRDLVQSMLVNRYFDVPLAAGDLDEMLQDAITGRTDPFTAAETIVETARIASRSSEPNS